MDPFDEGSDLSDLADSDASLPTTPGLALTPQTSPAHRAKDKSPGFPAASSSSDRKVSGSKSHSKRQQKKEGSNVIAHKQPTKKGKEADGEKVKRRTITLKHNKSAESIAIPTHPEPASSRSAQAGKSDPIAKSSAKRGWAYVPFVDETQEAEPTILDGKRSRKTTQHFVSSSGSVRLERESKSSSVDTPPSNVEQGPGYQEPSAMGASRPRIKINVNAKARTERKQSQVEGTTSQSPDEEGDEDDDDVVQPSRKRKRDRKHTLADTSDYEEDGRQPMPKKGAQRRPAVLKNSGGEDKTFSKRHEHSPGMSSEEDLSDEFKHSEEEDVVMSEDADEDDFRPAAPTKAAKEKTTTTNSIRRKSEGVPKDGMQKVEPRRSTGSAPSKNTVAGLISAYTKPAMPAPAPAKPAAKIAVRKVPSMNLFDNIMGFGSGSKQSTPAKGAIVRPRSSLSGVNTPQGSSPIVRPNGSGIAKDVEKSNSSTTPSRPATSTTPSNSARNGRMVTVDVRGANGEHVTAAEMAVRREKEIYANAHPKGVFDLLEGAEILMQFEDETRRLLEFDPLIARTKLYRASRTEGYPKLIDRIKQDQQKKKEALAERESSRHAGEVQQSSQRCVVRSRTDSSDWNSRTPHL